MIIVSNLLNYLIEILNNKDKKIILFLMQYTFFGKTYLDACNSSPFSLKSTNDGRFFENHLPAICFLI